MIGTTLSHYRIVEEIGRGGMGVVYVAEDARLQRRVAVKVLSDEVTQDETRRKRILKEARAAAAIEHPSLVAIHDIGEDKGHTFIAMEYVRGRSLRTIITGDGLGTVDALRIGADVAEALGKVHALGIVHRDIKPDNILITDDGKAKVIDFGLAKLLQPEETQELDGAEIITDETDLNTQMGVVKGTVGYMSPEQARGAELDARSDTFSLGVVLYETLTGKPLFKRGTLLTALSSILHDDMPELKVLDGKAPAGLEALLRRAVAKDPEKRYQSAETMARDLRKLHDRAQSGRLSGYALIAISALFIAGVALAWALHVTPEMDIAPAPSELVSVLIADFHNRTEEAVFDGALEQALSIGLEGAPFITSFNRATARSQAARLYGGADGALDERRARLFCIRQGINVAIVGAVAPSGDGYAIEVAAIDPLSSEAITELTKTASGKDRVLGVVDELANDLRAALGETSMRDESVLESETFTATSLDAVSRYARGQQLLSSGRYPEAADEFTAAVDLDPDFGRAYSSLAVLSANTGRPEQAEDYFAKALSLIGRMTERERLRTRGSYYLATMSYEKAIDEYSNLVREYPADSSGRSNLALAYFYARDMDEALVHGRRAADIYPLSAPRRNNVALYAMYAGDFDTTDNEARRALELNPNYEKAHLALALAHLGRSQLDAALDSYQRLEQVSSRGRRLAALGLADLELYSGRASEAVRLLQNALSEDDENPSTRARKLVALARAHAESGNDAQALSIARQAVDVNQHLSILFPAAMIFIDLGELEAARSQASSLRARLQTDARAYARLIDGELLLTSGDHHEAILAFQEAQEMADSWTGRMALARAYLAADAPIEAHSELEACLERRGEATAIFLDDIPTYREFPPVHYYLGLALDGLESPAAIGSFETYIDIRGDARDDPLLDDARRRVEAAGSR